MSDIETETTGVTRRKEQAKHVVEQAGQVLKAEAQSFASVAQDRVRAEAQKGTQVGAKTLGDFANAVRRAGDELAGADQSPASRLVRQAAEGLESLSRNLQDKDPGDLLNSVRDFGRRNPAAFIGGAVLVGLAIGRFARASEGSRLPGLSDDELAFAEEDAFDGPAETAYATGLSDPQADDLGALETATVSTTAPLVDVVGDTPGLDETDTTISPPLGGR